MKCHDFSRRRFLRTAAALPALHLIEVGEVSAVSSEKKPGRSTINANLAAGDLYMNLIKGLGLSSNEVGFQGSFDKDQYPQGIIRTPLTGNFPFPPSFFGRLVLKWRGRGSFQILAPPAIIYSGGANVYGLNASSGDVAGNMLIQEKTNPRIELAWGWKIQSITQSPVSNGRGGHLVRITSKPGFTRIVTNNSTIKVQGINGQANALGVWKCTKVDDQTFDLQLSTWNAADPYAGPSGEAILSVGQVQATLPSGTYSSFGGLVLCRATDDAIVDSGMQVSQAAINSYSALKPRYLRFMDMLAVIQSTATNFRYRSKPTAMNYAAGRTEPAYWVGRLERGPNDAYNCINPGASGTGRYRDGEIVQGYADIANEQSAPTLNVGRRGSKPVFSLDCTPQLMTLTGSSTHGDLIKLSFQASYINGGDPYVFNYTVNTSSGHYGPDANIDKLGANLTFAAGRDETLIAAGITFENPGGGRCRIVYNRNAGSETKFAASVFGAGTEAITFGTLKSGGILPNVVRTYTYSKILDGWIQNERLNSGVPLEVIAEICNRSNVGCWVNIPLLYSDDSAREFGATLGTLLNSGLPVVCELSNEIWNFAQSQTSMAMNLGCQLGLTASNNRAYLGFSALRTCQLLQAFANGWMDVGRPRSELKLIIANTILEGDGHYSGGMQRYQWNGADLDISKNTTLAALGGPAGAALSRSHNAFPNRPIDLVDGVSYALYWRGALARATSSAWSGAQALYDPLFKASADFAAGGERVNRALLAWDDDIRKGTKNGVAGAETIAAFTPRQIGFETRLTEYDGPRALAGLAKLGVYVYEAALEQGLGSNGINGTNSFDPTDLDRQFTVNGWTLFPTFGATNLEVASNIVRLFLAYKNSEYFADNVVAMFNQVITIHGARDAYPAWYGYSGPSIWSLFPADITSRPYKSYDAIAKFNRQS
jgi:hypothetical protein